MNPKQILMAGLIGSFCFFTSCNSGDNNADGSAADNSVGTDPKGIGKHQNVELSNPPDEGMATSGKNIFEVKCASCHKLSDERLVGPGLASVTERRTPEWIMNFITNTDEMIEKDTAAQRMLEQCLVRMPNQGLSDQDARHVLEFMRKNDMK
jgi:mono/diheme cytochrome c family protein